MTLLGVSARAKVLEVTCMVATEVPGGRGDPVRLRQILTNLLNNALRITE